VKFGPDVKCLTLRELRQIRAEQNWALRRLKTGLSRKRN
jgi:hypothetical protein